MKRKKKGIYIFIITLIFVIFLGVIAAVLLFRGSLGNIFQPESLWDEDTEQSTGDIPEIEDTESETVDTALPESESTASESETQASTEAETETETLQYANYLEESGVLELPVSGASGYAAIKLNLREKPDTNSALIKELAPGTGFTILSEEGDWWNVEADGTTGWVYHKYCMINLPDVVPSIVYDDTNSYASIFRSSGKDIPEITGQQLYNVYTYNERLGYDEYIMPVLYGMAKKICAAQQKALSEGNTLVIYETYRPYEVQKQVVTQLTALTKTDEQVNAGINTEPWSMEWFINTNVSNHQKGYAMDVSLAKVDAREVKMSGIYGYEDVTEYTLHTMPTAMHELSNAAVSMSQPVSSKDAEAWKSVGPAETMNAEALLLRQYCTDAGLTPLASEWWHFNDLDCAGDIDGQNPAGQFYIESCYSRVAQ